MKPRTVHTMSLVGGHPVLDFVNTVDSRIGRHGPDYLTTYHDLLIWAGRTQLIDAETQERLALQSAKTSAEAEAALSGAKALREALYGICCWEATNGPLDSSDLNLFNAALQRATAKRRVAAGQGGLEWTSYSCDTLEHIADCVSLAACDLMINFKGQRRLIRQCPGQNCGWLFLDTSRGGRRRWCSERSCGTLARVKKFRAE